VSVPQPQGVRRLLVGRNVWLGGDADDKEIIASLPVHRLSYEVLDSEESIGFTDLKGGNERQVTCSH